MAGPTRKQVGRQGEEAAAAYLAAQGYTILERNYRCRLGEIDLVCGEGEQLVFVEVRTRSSSGFGLPQESVTGRKQRKLRQLALVYLQQAGLAEVAFRFDVVAVRVDKEGRVKAIEHYPDAF